MDRQVRRLERFVVLTNEDSQNWSGFDNVIVIPNPIEKFPVVISDCSRKHAIAVGRYTWQKGFDLLIRAWKYVYAKHPEWVLDIYGPGNYEVYRQQVVNEGLSSVVKCHEADSDIFARFAESSIFILSSRYEGLPLVLGEAMATGLPIVSFCCPCGPKDIISDGKDGILVENGNVEKLAESIIYLIENETIRKQYGQLGRKTAFRYNEKSIMGLWIDLFNKL